MQTYWNGEPCEARKVRVIIGPSERPTWWCANLAGAEREAVRVEYGGRTFYLDNQHGDGWRKVTEGMGSPSYGHYSLPVERELS